MKEPAEKFDLAAIRARLAGARGRHYWRSLDELAESVEFRNMLKSEFPRQASGLDGIGRRDFMRLMAASLALGGLTACNAPSSATFQPYVKGQEGIVPGKPLFFATAVTLGGYAQGVLVETNMGRPTKIEGNPDHPASLGATDSFTQAAILGLYDPDRSQTITLKGNLGTWDAFLNAVRPELETARAAGGAGLSVLTETITSPTVGAQLQALLKAFPAAKWHQYEPCNRDNVLAGALLAFGENVTTVHHFDKAGVVLSLDADFLGSGPACVRYTRDFSSKRRVRSEKGGLGQSEMNRLYVLESSPSITGFMADHRLPLRGSQIEMLARQLASRLKVEGVSGGPEDSGVAEAWTAALLKDLGRHPGSSIVIAGDAQPPEVHALVHAINQALGNIGKTVVYKAPVEAQPVDQADSLRELVADMSAGKVNLLFVLGANPVFNTPADLKFGESVSKVKLTVHHGVYEDETAQYCQWHIPQAHELETWGDARAYDGTTTIQQPLIAPLYGGRSTAELLATVLGQSDPAHDLVHDYWMKQESHKNDEAFWRRSVHDGLVSGSEAPDKQPMLRPLAIKPPVAESEGFELNFRLDPTLWDGRFANNGWLQELPKPVTKLTWDNVAHFSPADAETLGLNNGDVVELKFKDYSVRAPAWITPGQARKCVTVHFGYGRTRAGRVGNGTGFNAYAIRTSGAPWRGTGLQIVKTGGTHPLSCTQNHHSMEGRDIVRMETVAEFEHRADAAAKVPEKKESRDTLYPPVSYEGYSWGMAIDQSACTGCSACVLACQSENNIPVVGKEQVAAGREMHWLRIDRYFEGSLDNPTAALQPMACVHCETAPCELVCPVGATVHSSEGLNMMVYNRCVGTRYCGNNCPYKVRRFNFFEYANRDPALQLMYNPEVTVRERGVMEKCTYCIQRISTARVSAEVENRPIRDGEIVTACQAVCPAEAIVFGNVNDPNSRVSKLKAQPHNYGVLAELGTVPRTTHLSRVNNPNPEIEALEAKGTAL